MYPLWVTDDRYTTQSVYNILSECSMCYMIETGRLLGVYIKGHRPNHMQDLK